VRYPRELRDSIENLRQLPILTDMGQQITLGTVARLKISEGPPMLKSENARPSGWVYIDVRGRDLASTVKELRTAVVRQVPLKAGMSIAYSGQFEYLERANARLKLVVPATLLIIFVLLYLTFRRIDEAALIMGTLPFALTGGIWFLYLQGYNLSIATGVGFIALAGVAAEFGVVMLLYLKQAAAERQEEGARFGVGGSGGCDSSRRGDAGPAESHDGRGDRRGVAADFLGPRDRFGSDEPHSSSDGGRHDHRPVAVDVRDSRSVQAHASEAARSPSGAS
jgi:hypothetical protein